MKRQKTIGLKPSSTRPLTSLLGLLELRVLLAGRAPPRSGPSRGAAARGSAGVRPASVGVGARGDVAALGGSSSSRSQHGSARRSRRPRRRSRRRAVRLRVAQGRGRGGGLRAERPQERQDGPPADALAAALPPSVSRTISRAYASTRSKSALVLGGELVGLLASRAARGTACRRRGSARCRARRRWTRWRGQAFARSARFASPARSSGSVGERPGRGSRGATRKASSLPLVRRGGDEDACGASGRRRAALRSSVALVPRPPACAVASAGVGLVDDDELGAGAEELVAVAVGLDEVESRR